MKPLRKATVMFKERMAGVVEEIDAGYRFTYDPNFLKNGEPIAVARYRPAPATANEPDRT